MKAEFEEKTYENLMNIAFACEFNAINIFAPGQILENSLGFDVAMYIKNKKFFRLFFDGYFLYKKWEYFSHINYKTLRTENEKLEEILKNTIAKFNIFIQYKRSDFFNNKNAKCYQHWNKPFYRYALYDEQHKLLLSLNQNIKDKAFVIYAAPVFHTLKELYQYINDYKQIIDNSNFCDVGKLNKQHMYVSFIKGGKYNIACSEPEKIEYLDIKKEIEKLKLKRDNYSDLLYFKIKELSNFIDKIMSKKDKEEKNYLKSIYKFLIEISPFQNFKVLNMIYKIQLFQLLTNTNILWNIEYKEDLWEKTPTVLKF